MVMTCGVGAFVAAVFHLLAHGFLKAFLFLSTGNALQASRRITPATTAHARRRSAVPFGPLAWGALLFACIPPAILFSGPYEAMWTLHRTPAARSPSGSWRWPRCFSPACTFRGSSERFFGGLRRSGRDRCGRSCSPFPTSSSSWRARWCWWGSSLGSRPGSPRFSPRLWRRSAGRSVHGWPPALLGLAALAAAGRRSAAGRSPSFRRRPGSLAAERVGEAPVRVVLEQALLRRDLRRSTSCAEPARWRAAWPQLDRARVDGPVAEPARVSRPCTRRSGCGGCSKGGALDRAVGSTATASCCTARWLWRVLEGRGIQGVVGPACRTRRTRSGDSSSAGAAHAAGTSAARRRRPRRAPRAVLPGHSRGLAMTELSAAHLLSVLIAVPFVDHRACSR